MIATVGAFFLGCFVGAAIGLFTAALAAAAAREDVANAAYLRGLEKGKALARANGMHDLIASDTAAALAEPREPRKPAA